MSILLSIAAYANIGTEVGYGGDPQPIKAMSLNEAKKTLGLSSSIISDALDIAEKRINKVKSRLPKSMIKAIEKELQLIRSNSSTVIKVIKDPAIPVTRGIRCGYKQMVKVSAFTGLSSLSPIYFSKDFLQNALPTNLAKLLFHEMFRHVAGQRINCMDDFIHQFSRFVFAESSNMTKKRIKAYWTIKDGSLNHNLMFGIVRPVAETRAIFEVYKSAERATRYEISRDKFLLYDSVRNESPNIKITREIFDWYLKQELKFRIDDIDRLNVWDRLITLTTKKLVNYGLGREYERRFTRAMIAIHKNWELCTSQTMSTLDHLADQKSLTRAAKRKILSLKRRLRSNRRFRRIKRKGCPAI